MILCDICGKSMTPNHEGRVPFLHVQGFQTKHACDSCQREWLKTKEQVAEIQRKRAREEEANAWREFCEIRRPEFIWMPTQEKE